LEIRTQNGEKIMDRILIIGANWEQAPLLRKAKEMKLYVIATNPYPEAEGFQYSDESYTVEPRDLLNIEQIFSKSQPDAVIADECDYSMFASAYLTSKYGLPGPQMDSLLTTTNKFLEREAASKTDIKQPGYELCMTYAELEKAVDRLGLPVMLKPIDNRGSIGLTKVEKREDLLTSFYKTLPNSHARQILVEEFIEGDVVTIEGVYATCFHNLSFSTKKMHPQFPDNAMHLQYPGNLSSEVKSQLYHTNQTLVEAIGIGFGLTHSEFVLAEDGIYLLEVHNRGGGVYISNKIMPAITGIDIPEFLIRSSFGENITIGDVKKADVFKGAYAILHFFDFGQGRVKSIRNAEVISQLQGVLAFRLSFGVGDQLEPIETAVNRPGFVIVAGDTLDECMSLIEHIEELIEIKFE
jgi:biotin carboxylase